VQIPADATFCFVRTDCGLQLYQKAGVDKKTS
jgi:hypothetical protein